MPGLEDAYSNMTAACIPSTSVHGSDKAIGVPLLRAALAGAETPVAFFLCWLDPARWRLTSILPVAPFFLLFIPSRESIVTHLEKRHASQICRH